MTNKKILREWFAKAAALPWYSTLRILRQLRDFRVPGMTGRMQNHRYSMDQSKAACSAPLQYLIDGVVVAQIPELQFDPALRARLQRDATLGEVVRVLGPGHIVWGSGVGNIIWRFTDGQMISTAGHPQTLSDPVRLKEALNE